MKFQYMSDIHLEFYKDITPLINQIQHNSDILILAGDIGNPFETNYEEFLSFISKTFEKTFIIAGNHEYYYNNIEDANNKMKDIINKFNNISLLLNSFEDFDGIRWIGTTLWSHITKSQYNINDTNKIPNLTIEKYNNMHFECVNFLENAINSSNPCIIITHHLPIYDLTAKKYRTIFYENYREWFNANLDEFIKKNNNKIKAWIYGHPHTQTIQIKYDIPFLCNPLGYPNENNLTRDYFSKVFFLLYKKNSYYNLLYYF